MGKSNDWKQQHLPYLTFLLTPKWTIITMSIISLICLPLGIYFFIDNSRLSEFIVDYSNCVNSESWQNSSSNPDIQWKYFNSTKNCTIRFPITEKLQNVHLYIRLSNFYQNHRLYVTSLNAPQLQGTVMQASDLDSASSKTSCSWLTYANCETASKFTWSEGNGMTFAENNPDCMPQVGDRDAVIKNAASDAQYYPCGLVANSFFTGIF